MIGRLFRLLILFPHIITFIRMNKKPKEMFVEDMKLYYEFMYNKHWRLDLRKEFDRIKLFCKLMNNHKDVRNIFYFRLIECNLSYVGLLKLLCQPISTLYMTPPKKMYVSGGGILFQHPFSTIINAKKIGRGCIIRNNTTIGNTLEILTNVPTIGDHVNIGAGCIIIGNITIGSNVTIGAGSIVVKDVPSNCIIAGNPARIIRMKA